MNLEAENLTVRFDNTTILSDVGLSLCAGQIVGLIGPNGAGKTTLLRVLADLMAPSAGSVRYDGMTRRLMGRGKLARRLSFLAQGGDVYWPPRVDHIVGLGRLPNRRPFAGLRTEDHAPVERALIAAVMGVRLERSKSNLRAIHE